MTYSGWLFPVRELFPRITTRVEDVGPPAEINCTPDTFPDSMFSKFASRTSVVVPMSIDWRAYPKDLASRLIPKAVTTTSTNYFVSSASVTLMSFLFLSIRTFCALYPIKETRIKEFSLTWMLNFPSILVTVLAVPPTTDILAPMITSPFSSTTVPLTFIVEFCAKVVPNDKNAINRNSANLRTGWWYAPVLSVFLF